MPLVRFQRLDERVPPGMAWQRHAQTALLQIACPAKSRFHFAEVAMGFMSYSQNGRSCGRLDRVNEILHSVERRGSGVARIPEIRRPAHEFRAQSRS
jgi:hypothetical protein